MAAGNWFVIPVMPGTLTQIKVYVLGGSGAAYQVKFATGAQAQAYASAGYQSFATQAAAKAAAKADLAQVQPLSPTGPGNQAASQNAGSLFGPLAQVGDFFARLSEGSTWIRIGEVILGLALISIGVARLTHAVPPATAIAKAAGAAALA